MRDNKNIILKGTLSTIMGAICWGFSGACGQFLFQNYNLNSNWLTSIRMVVAGIIMCFYMILKEKKEFFNIWHNKRDSIQLVLFSIIGLMLCQYTYLTAIKYTNAGTATVLQYIGPVFIMIYVCIVSFRLPEKREVIAIITAVIGTFILATHGNIHSLVISEKGLFWGLASAFSMMLYTLIPSKIISKYGTVKIIGYGMIIGGLFLSIITGIWNINVNLDFLGVIMVGIISVIGTLVAFSLYLYGVSVIGAVKGSMIASVEPVSATVFSVLWLKSSFGVIDFIGFIFIMATVFILSKK